MNNTLMIILSIVSIIATVLGILVIIIKGSKWFGATDTKMEQLRVDLVKQNGVDKKLFDGLHQKVEVTDCDKFQSDVSKQLGVIVEHLLEG